MTRVTVSCRGGGLRCRQGGSMPLPLVRPAILAVALVAACEPPSRPANQPPPPPFGHVFIVTEENHNYASVIGSSAMPYLDSLAHQYGLATQYYANTHPSIGNYFMLATGQIITNNDGYSTIVAVDNVVRRLLAVGKSWKSYAEDLPAVGYTGGDVGNYARKHNVFALLS